MARHRPHLLVPGCGGPQNPVSVSPATVHHLEQVLRIENSAVSYTDGAGLFGTGTYSNGMIARGEEASVARPTELTVAVAPPRTNNRVRFLVEKLGELGVRRLLWLRTAYTEGRRPRPEKSARWAASALEQARGAWLMEIRDEPVPVAAVDEYGSPVFAVAGGSDPAQIVGSSDLVVCIGPEGGFAPGEVPDSAQRVNLGPTILRIETAAITAVALLRNRAE